MKPLKGLQTISIWFLRISVLVFAFTNTIHQVKTFDIKSLSFYIAAALSLFSLLLFVGGFFAKHTLTMTSSIILFLIAIYKLIFHFSMYPSPAMSLFLLLAAISLFFISTGNKK